MPGITNKEKMVMDEQQIYREFITWLKQSWYDLPESDELLPMIMAAYSLQDAELLTGMPFSGKNLDDLAALKQMDAADLRIRLDDLARRGLVFCSKKGDSFRYSLNDSFFVFLRSAFWAGRTEEPTKSIAPHVNRYMLNGLFDQYGHVTSKGLRTIPIQSTIDDPRQVLPYEDVVKVLEQEDYFCVSTCACKHRKNLDPDSPSCRYPDKVCLHFGRLAHYMADHELGREITRKEAHEVLSQAAEAGLVHGISNWVNGPDTICNCCPCCCLWFEGFHVLKHSRSLDPSNYRVYTNPETCLGCGLCVERCPMKALHLESSSAANNDSGEIAVLKPDLCLGCGVCVYKCPSDSLVLVRRDETTDPPNDPREYTQRFIANVTALPKLVQDKL